MTDERDRVGEESAAALQTPYRERERSVTMERMGEEPVSGTEALVKGDLDEELFTINIGPHHPATHGVLRLLTTLEGEMVRDVKPIIGYVHTGIEKSCEDQQYWKVITFVERMDYLAYYFNAQVSLHVGGASCSRSTCRRAPSTCACSTWSSTGSPPTCSPWPRARSTSAR